MVANSIQTIPAPNGFVLAALQGHAYSDPSMDSRHRPEITATFLAVASDGKEEKAQSKVWGDSQDWLALLVANLSDPVIIAMAGATHWTTRQYFQFFSSVR